jgi:hypothetical protein
MAGPRSSALPPNYVGVGLSGGIDAKSDRKTVQPPQTLVADNVRYNTANSVRKRYGINFIAEPSPNGLASSLGFTNDELLAIDESYMYAYAPASNTWANRGTCPQTALNVSTIGNYQLPLGAGITAPNEQIRQITYDVVGNLGLAAWDTGDTIDTIDQYNNNYLGAINLCLFDTETSKPLWTTQINNPYVGTGPHNFNIFGINPGVTGAIPLRLGSSVAVGCGYPIIRAFSDKFYLAYIGCIKNLLFFLQQPTPAEYLGCLYFIQWIRLDPGSIAASPPSVTQATLTGVDALISTNLASITSNNFQGPAPPSPAVPSIYFDMATNGQDLILVANGQSYYNYGFTEMRNLGQTTWTMQGVTSPTQSSAVTYHDSTGLTGQLTAGPISLTATPAVPLPAAPGSTAVTYPSDTGYVGMFANSLLTLAAPCTGNGGQGWGFALTGFSPTGPLSANVTGSAGAYEIQLTDGLTYGRYKILNSNLYQVTPIVANAPVVVDYAMSAAGTKVTVFGSNTTEDAIGYPISITSIPRVASGPVLQSRIFQAPDGQPVAWVMCQGVTQSEFNCLALVNIGNAVTPLSVYAHAFYLRAGNALVGRVPCNVVNSAFLAFQVVDIPNQIAAIKYVSLSDNPAPNIVKLNQGALVTGADTKYYDGASVRTCGWLKFPELSLSFILDNISTSVKFKGFQYSYIAVWVDYDAYGNAIYSSPSAAAAAVWQTNYIGGGYVPPPAPGVLYGSGLYQQVLMTQAQYDLLQPTRGSYILYRTCGTGNNTTTYRRIPPLTAVPNFNVLAPGAGPTQTVYMDLTPDDNTANPLLYSQPSGGELPNDPPPASSYAVTNIKRAFVASAENPSWLYFGKPYYPGRPPEFSALQFLDIDPPSGNIAGLAVLDQNIVIFKKERIFVLSGDGPDATGAGAFNNTFAVATDTGCMDDKSIVSTESGVYFRSVRGIQLLDRSLAVTYIGAPVERLIANSTITSSALVPGQNQIRFALASNDPAISGTSADNVVLVYDYFLQRWSTYGFRPGYDLTRSLTLIGQATWRNNWFGLAGNAVFEDAGPYSTGTGGIQFTDGSVITSATAPSGHGQVYTTTYTQVHMTIETAWIPLAGPMGFGRLRRISVLGDFRANHVISLYIAFDYNDTYLYEISYTPQTLHAHPGDAQEWRIRSPRQVGQSVKFRLVDSSVGEACVITGLLLETSQKSGGPRLPDAQSV